MHCGCHRPTIGGMKTPLAHPVSLSIHRLTRACIAGALVSITGFVLTDNVAHASNFAVVAINDGVPGSLREAIDMANANPGPDTIILPAGTFTLSLTGRGDDANLTGDLDILGPTTIIGAGAGLTTIDAAGIDRVFDIIGGSTVLQGLTITNGAPAVGVSASGGNIREQSGNDLTIQDSIVSNGSASYGGAVFGDTGALTIARSELVGNSVIGAIGVGGYSGIAGAIYKGGGSLVLSDSSVIDNHADFNAAAIVYFTAGLDLTVTNSTISNNTAESRIVLLEAQQSQNFAATFNHVTIANNTTVSLGGGGAGLSLNLIAPAIMPVTVTGSLFVHNLTGATSSNCAFSGTGSPVITSGGNNLSDDATCTSFTNSGDLNNNQLTTLGALANNGGPTRTLALGTGSSAIDAAGACQLTTDQRGVSRPKGAACDIGAFEADAAVNPTTTTETPTTEAPTTQAPTTQAPGSTLVEPPTSVTQTTFDGGVVDLTTVPPIATFPPFYGGQLPSTGSSHSGGLWLALVACSLGTMLVLTARRRAR